MHQPVRRPSSRRPIRKHRIDPACTSPRLAAILVPTAMQLALCSITALARHARFLSQEYPIGRAFLLCPLKRVTVPVDLLGARLHTMYMHIHIYYYIQSYASYFWASNTTFCTFILSNKS